MHFLVAILAITFLISMIRRIKSKQLLWLQLWSRSVGHFVDLHLRNCQNNYGCVWHKAFVRMWDVWVPARQRSNPTLAMRDHSWIIWRRDRTRRRIELLMIVEFFCELAPRARCHLFPVGTVCSWTSRTGTGRLSCVPHWEQQLHSKRSSLCSIVTECSSLIELKWKWLYI